MKYLLLITIIYINLNGAYSELLFNGNCITCHKTNNLNKSAPTIQEIQKEYKNAFPNKEEFVSYMSRWVLNPKEKTSLMQDKIEFYGLMPDLAYDENTLKEIAEYIFDNNFK
ncbi:MAG: cytochrome C [Arcobacter sp.]|nr:cytochrome C [Arcobacter sp.]|tara:strand:- start:43 stop:378 length:336 start_codon:yes stop_codon:yes gene_type:complete